MFQNLNKIFKNSLNKISLKKIFFLYFFYSLTILILSFIYVYLVIEVKPSIADEKYNLLYSEIPFGYGPLLENIIKHNNFFVVRHDNIIYYLSRLPFHTLFLALIIKINSNIFFVYGLKNFFLYSFFFYISYISIIKTKKNFFFFILLLLLILFNYYNLHVSLSIDFEDTYLTILIPCLFLLLISNYNFNKKFFYISVILFILYFTKTSMFFLVITIPIIILFIYRNFFFSKFLPLIFIFSAVLIWGFYGYSKTGKFPFFKSSISNNTEGLSAVMNSNFKNYYPKVSVDLIPNAYVILPEDKKKLKLNNEWDVYYYFDKKNKEYLETNKKEYFYYNLISKIKFIFFNIYKDNVFPDKTGNYSNPLLIAYLINKVILNISFFSSIIIFFNSLYRYKFEKIEFYFLTIFFLNLLPHLIGWATAKHLVPISNVALIYLFFRRKIILNSYLKIIKFNRR